jgi:DNA polymerase (family 10)
MIMDVDPAPQPLTNQEIASVFDEIARLLELRKDNIFKIRAYRKVARSISELSEPVVKLVDEDRIKEIPGAGEAIAKKITEMVRTGRLEYYEKLKKEVSLPRSDS